MKLESAEDDTAAVEVEVKTKAEVVVEVMAVIRVGGKVGVGLVKRKNRCSPMMELLQLL